MAFIESALIPSQIFGLPEGSFPQWMTLLVIVAGGVTVFIKGIPQRINASSAAKQADNADYASQIREFREEVHGYRNELQVIMRKLEVSESMSRRRGDRIKNMLFVLRLVMGELRRLDPESAILLQAERALSDLEASEDDDATKTTTLRAAEKTLHAAERTVDEVMMAEGVKK